MSAPIPSSGRMQPGPPRRRKHLRLSPEATTLPSKSKQSPDPPQPAERFPSPSPQSRANSKSTSFAETQPPRVWHTHFIHEVPSLPIPHLRRSFGLQTPECKRNRGVVKGSRDSARSIWQRLGRLSPPRTWHIRGQVTRVRGAWRRIPQWDETNLSTPASDAKRNARGYPSACVLGAVMLPSFASIARERRESSNP